MPRRIPVPRRADPLLALAVLCALLVSTPGPLEAQWPPDSLTNLRVLPDDIAFPELMRTMAGFTRALGVRCSTCHVGEEGAPLSTYDFASDDPDLKKKARAMLRMVAAINGEGLAGLESRADPAVEVQCFTCHRGARLPRTLQAELRIAYDEGGLDALVARYRELREAYHGRATYDFGPVALADIGGELAQAGASADAETVHALNVEMNPGDRFAQRQYAALALANAFREGPGAGEARYLELLAIYGPGALPEPAVNRLGYTLLDRGDAEAAIVAFRLNADAHPDSWNAWDSLGEAYERAGNDGAAVDAYRRSLELDPSNERASERIRALGG
ncbi:MAG: c-type cytochrome [Gemmatimonadota bacterium]|jgi:tetratricopeptide (TPR) repeat protein